MIEDLIAQLDASLRGPRRAKRRLLAEAEAGLKDAVRSDLATGLDPARAAARAVAEFGSVAEVRAHYQVELDVVHTRRTASLSVLLLPLVTLYWNVVWELNPYPTWQVLSVPFLIVATASVIAMAAAVPSTAALVVTGRYGRDKTWTGMGRQVRLLTGTGIGAFVVATLMLPIVNLRTLLWPPTTATLIAAVVLGVAATKTCRSDPGGSSEIFSVARPLAVIHIRRKALVMRQTFGRASIITRFTLAAGTTFGDVGVGGLLGCGSG